MRTQSLLVSLASLLLFANAPAFAESTIHHAAPTAAPASPTAAYAQLHKQELAATKYEDLLKLRSTRSVAKDKPTSEEEKKQMFVLLKMLMPKEVKIVSEQINGNEAVLNAVAPPGPMDAPDSKTTGKITLLKENGAWKLDAESWETKLGKNEEKSEDVKPADAGKPTDAATAKPTDAPPAADAK